MAHSLVRSRTQATRPMAEGRARMIGVLVQKPAVNVDASAEISADTEKWVSRAARRLLGAIADSGTSLYEHVLDAGVFIGGFTQVALEHGLDPAYAVGVGYHQLAASIRLDPHVRIREGLNLRDLSLADLDDEPVNVMVGDVSFISLELLLPSLLRVIHPGEVALLLVKPQSEVGKKRLDTNGVVRDPRLREEAVDAAIRAADALGWGCD